MGELILCRQSIAANPYFIEDGALNVYSLEELSYYIAHNVYLLNAEFASKELCLWIGGELGARDLEKQLLDTLSNQAPLHIFIGQILNYSGYLTSVEIRDLLQAIASFENKSPTECQKMRADRLMEKDKIVDAIFEYEKMLDDPAVTHGPTAFEGDIWHNLALPTEGCFSLARHPSALRRLTSATTKRSRSGLCWRHCAATRIRSISTNW